jgi:hypothetical protein
MSDVLLQYGAIGVIALLALAAVRVLFAREVKAHQDQKDRADRLEVELRKLNETIQTQYITTLAQATLAMSQAFDVIREVDRERRGRPGRERSAGQDV